MRNNSIDGKDDLSLEVQENKSRTSMDRQRGQPSRTGGFNNNERRSFIKTQLAFLAEQMVFNFRKAKTKRYDMNKIIYKGLLFLLIEYLLYFAFQLISFLVLKETWKDMSFIPGIVLGIFFVGSAIIIIILMNRQNKNMCLILIVKFFEFASYMLLTGYLTAIDFGFMSLSYIIVINILLIYLFVF